MIAQKKTDNTVNVDDITKQTYQVHYSKLNDKEKELVQFIPYGSAFPVSMFNLARLLNMDARTIRSMINRVSEKGVPIGIDRHVGHSGYFIALSNAERTAGLCSLINQRNELDKRIEAVQGTSLDDWQLMTGFYGENEKDGTN